MKEKSIRTIFWVLFAVFILAILAMLVPPIARLPFYFVGIPSWVIIAGLSVVLIVLTVKRNITGMPKKFLLLTGASGVGLPFFAVLHNVISGLTNTEEPVFFILASIVCPIAFLVGVVGTIVLASKNKP